MMTLILFYSMPLKKIKETEALKIVLII